MAPNRVPRGTPCTRAKQVELDSYGNLRIGKGDEGFCNYLYQGQTLDSETGLAYNRFRYYDPEQGNYISQDPIGLAGGIQLYRYVHDTNDWIDPLGLASGPWGDGDFGTWFDKASVQDIINNKSAVSQALRGDGGKHEMFPVSMAAKAKELEFTHAELMGMTADTKAITFVDVPDSKGILHTGKHPSPGTYNSAASSNFHKRLMADLNGAKTKQEALDIIKKHHDAHMKTSGCQ